MGREEMPFPRALRLSETDCPIHDLNSSCDVTPSRPPHVTSTFRTIPLLSQWSTSGSERGNAYFLPLQEYNRGNRRKKRTNTNNMLGVNSRAEREFCNTLCMCRLTLVWILANFYKATGMQTHLPSQWLDPHVMLTRLSATVSGVDCPCPCPVAKSCELLCPTNSLFASPSTSGHGEISSPKPFVWFRAKTDKGIVCLAGHLHSVT